MKYFLQFHNNLKMNSQEQRPNHTRGGGGSRAAPPLTLELDGSIPFALGSATTQNVQNVQQRFLPNGLQTTTVVGARARSVNQYAGGGSVRNHNQQRQKFNKSSGTFAPGMGATQFHSNLIGLQQHLQNQVQQISNRSQTSHGNKNQNRGGYYIPGSYDPQMNVHRVPYEQNRDILLNQTLGTPMGYLDAQIMQPTGYQPPQYGMIPMHPRTQSHYVQTILNQTQQPFFNQQSDAVRLQQLETPVNFNHQRRLVKHNKTISQVNPYSSKLNNLHSSRIAATEQFLNQPISAFSRPPQQLQQTLSFGTPQLQHYAFGGMQQQPTAYTPINFQTLNQQPHPQSDLAQYLGAMQQHQQTPKTALQVYNPFNTLLKQGTGSINSSQSRMSASKIKQQTSINATAGNNAGHVRSYSTYSKQQGVTSQRNANNSSTRRRGIQNNTMLNNLTNSLGSVTNNQQILSEAQSLESEEYFEQGKILLADKKYREAIKAFQKAIENYKDNYDARFYKGVAELDNGQPDKAIVDLNELIESCQDYRKTVFIVLSIAYRRVNDYTGALRTLSKAIAKYPRYIEAYIARGQIYIFQKKWDKALSDFRVVIQVAPQNGLGYLGQGDCLKGIGNYQGALQSYTAALDMDGSCIQQALMKRGILQLQMTQNQSALDDFNKLCDLAEQESTVATTSPHSLQDTLSPTAKTDNYIAVGKAYFYKAKALKKLNNCNDATLYFEQVIRMCSDDQFLQSSALYEIAKIKIEQKDFYEAYYNLQRATHYKLKQKKLINYKIFTEGVIFLMKRKTKTGIKLLTSLIDKLNQSSPLTQSDYITPLVYLYRAYGHFTSDDFDLALKDYLKSNQLKKLNAQATFNMVMCQGLKALEKKEYENAISFFSKAGQKMPGNRDPYFLRAVSVVQYAVHKPLKHQTKNKMLRDAKRDLNRALKHSPKDYQIMYFRGLLNFALHYFYDAITDFETVIEKSEETQAKFYLARGRCYACLSMFKEAITDLSIAINLNKDLVDAYLNRGKCAYLIGDTGLAFMDFQKLIVLEPKNPIVHIYAGNLLMTTGSYEDATKAFTNADNIHKSPLALYQRSRCHVALNNMSGALADLNRVIEQSPNDKVAIADRECLNALKMATVGVIGNSGSSGHNIGNASNSIVEKPHPPLDKQVYEKAIVILTKLISYEKNQHLAKINHDSSVLYQHSQIIPSAQRTKTDKVKAIRRRREQDRQMKTHGIGDNPLRKNDLRFRVQQQQNEEDEGGHGQGEDTLDDYDEISGLDEAEIDTLNKQLEQAPHHILHDGTHSQQEEPSTTPSLLLEDEQTNYYKENIFNKEDYYLYRAVMHFYSGDYDRALNDFEQSSSIMHSQKVLYPRNQFPDHDDADGEDAKSQDSSQTDLSDVGLCSLNIHEYSFNTVLCLLQMREYKKALTKMDYIIDTIPKKYAGQMWLIRGLVNQQVGGNNSQQAKKDFKRAYKYDPENTTRYLDSKQSIYLSVFPQQSRLCHGMAWTKFTFSTQQQSSSACIYMKPSFSFPFIKPPNMIPCVDNSVLEQFTSKAVPLKPEAPWIKRCSFGIKFTDEIYFTDDDREATPDEEKEYKKRKQQQQQRAARAAAAYPRSLSERVVLHTNIFLDQQQQQQQQQPHHNNPPFIDLDHDVDIDELQNIIQFGGGNYKNDMEDDDDDMPIIHNVRRDFKPPSGRAHNNPLGFHPSAQQDGTYMEYDDIEDEDDDQVLSGAAGIRGGGSNDDDDDDSDIEATMKAALVKAQFEATKIRPRSKK